jgi:CheY-like chemotaxis protein
MHLPHNKNHLTVVLAEDDDGHALLVTKNIERAGHAGHVVRLRDGRETLDYFLGPQAGREQNGEHNGSRAILLLDINMPRLSGIEVLERLKQDAATTNLPVIMLTTTDDPQEVARCYRLGCNVYVRKPVVYEEFVDAIERLGRFLQVIQVPTDVAAGA